LVTHCRRYTFWSATEDFFPETDPPDVPANETLDEIQTVISYVELVRELPTGTRFWRARSHKNGEELKLPEEFTSPPLECATEPNRMSPAGIPMFYGADDFDTAVREITPRKIPRGQQASAVQFMCLRPLQILDLDIPDWDGMALKRSYFACDGRKWRHCLRFLRQFSRELSTPFIYGNEFLQEFAGKHNPHIDYVPTQVFTEYVRYHMRSFDGRPVDGIRYRSSLNHQDHGSRIYPSCYVLFFDQDDCLPGKGRRQSLECDMNSRKTAAVPLPCNTGL
jgi:hypothetical protein